MFPTEIIVKIIEIILNFGKEYHYFKQFDELLPENNHLIAVVIFKTQLDEAGNYVPSNFVVTGWAKYIVPKR